MFVGGGEHVTTQSVGTSIDQHDRAIPEVSMPRSADLRAEASGRTAEMAQWEWPFGHLAISHRKSSKANSN